MILSKIRLLLVNLSFGLMLISPNLFGQSDNLKKYFVYRERVRDYIANSNNMGSGLPANYRSAQETDGKARPSWADAAWNLGYWIGTLAMEYKLLHDKGMDVSKTKEELYYAIYAMGKYHEIVAGVNHKL